MEKIDGCRVTISEVARDLREISIDFAPCIDEDNDQEGANEEENYLDVRLQVHAGSWALHTGDSQYDQDHRGYWGSASIDGVLTRKAAREMARDLIDQAADQFAECQ